MSKNIKNLKEAFYFPHYCNARHDRKLKRIRKDLGVEGYGIFFMLLEVLREQGDMRFPMSDTDLLAEEFGTSQAKIEAVIKAYDLFSIDNELHFKSPKLHLYMQPYFEKSERAKIANAIRWEAYNNKKLLEAKSNPNGIQMDSVSESKSESKSESNKRKGKERKEKKRLLSTKESPEGKSFIFPNNIPTLNEVSAYCLERNNTIDPEEFLDANNARGWVDKHGNRYSDWKAVLRTWERFRKNTMQTKFESKHNFTAEELRDTFGSN